MSHLELLSTGANRWPEPVGHSTSTGETKNWPVQCLTPQEHFRVSWKFPPQKKVLGPKIHVRLRTLPHYLISVFGRGQIVASVKANVSYLFRFKRQLMIHLVLISVYVLSTTCHPLKGLILVVLRPHTQSSGLSYCRAHTKTTFDTSSTHFFVCSLPLYPIPATPPSERDPDRALSRFT